MADDTPRPKRTLKDVSHHFLSSLEEKQGVTIHAPSQQPSQRRQLTTALHLVSINPVRNEPYSLLFHMQFARLFFNSAYKIYIVSLNPQRESWDLMEKQYALPALPDLDVTNGVCTFPIYTDVELLVTTNEYFSEFFNFSRVPLHEEQLLSYHDRPVLILIDAVNSDNRFRDMVLPCLDTLLLQTPVRIEDLRHAYKTVKAYHERERGIQFGLILEERENPTLSSFVEAEFSSITKAFLQCSVSVAGFCKEIPSFRTNNIRWNTPSHDQSIYSCNTSFITSRKRDIWSEELISFYQTVLNNAK